MEQKANGHGTLESEREPGRRTWGGRKEKKAEKLSAQKKWDKLGQLLVTFCAPYILSTRYRYRRGSRVTHVCTRAPTHIFHARLNRLKRGGPLIRRGKQDKRGSVRRSHFEYYRADDDATGVARARRYNSPFRARCTSYGTRGCRWLENNTPSASCRLTATSVRD